MGDPPLTIRSLRYPIGEKTLRGKNEQYVIHRGWLQGFFYFLQANDAHAYGAFNAFRKGEGVTTTASNMLASSSISISTNVVEADTIYSEVITDR